jgi:inorganic pyrophosphatase
LRTYPADYGLVPETLAGYGDPLDALVLIDEPVVPGCIVHVALLGVLLVADEHGDDPKLITILRDVADEVGWDEITDLPARRLEEIEHFFAVYKDLDAHATVTTDGYGRRDEAIALVTECRNRFAG